MSEPETRANQIDPLFPWLLHWSIRDERLSEFRSDAFALETSAGWILIDPVPLEPRLQDSLKNVAGIVLTHRNHQRAAWRLRRELKVPVSVPAGSAPLDETPDVTFDANSSLPAGLTALHAEAFDGACYLTFTHSSGTSVLFCGDLLCHDPDGPYRFPVQPGYFDPAAGTNDARQLIDLPSTALCAAHGKPLRQGCREALRNAVARA